MTAVSQETTNLGQQNSPQYRAGACLKFADLDDLQVVVIHTGEQASRDTGIRATLQRARNDAIVAENPIDPECEPEQTLYVAPAQLDEGAKLDKMADRDATKRVIVHLVGNLATEKAKRLVVALREQAPHAEIYRGNPHRNAEPWQLVDVVALEQTQAANHHPHNKQNSQRGEVVSLHPTGLASSVKATEVMIDKMSASQRAALLMARLGEVAINIEADRVYCYDGSLWLPKSDTELRREMAATFTEHEAKFSDKGIAAAVATMKLMIDPLSQPANELIGFANGVYDMATRQFRPHSPLDGLLNHNGIEYANPLPDESIECNAPSFIKWLQNAAEDDAEKMERIKAALFMVLANRYDWQLFLEVTGEGGSGKSIFAKIATLLAGGQRNTGSGSMATLDNARGRAQFVDKRLIALPDQPQYVGEGSGIKAITGGDMVEIDGKYEKQFGTIIKAVVLITNNEPMKITERNGGVSRRRVIFTFNRVVSDADKDPLLGDKIAAELPVVIRHLLTQFANPEVARSLLLEQRNGSDALLIKRATDPVIDFCATLNFMDEAKGLYMGGNSAMQPQPRRYLYHLYLAFMGYHGLGRPLSVQAFTRAIKVAAKEFGAQYLSRTIKGKAQTNVALSDAALLFIPQAAQIGEA
ncbi:DNA primase family protein [Aeromonas sp. 23P]|uniref:DNA primase family protein n=1 Tax=unclassified Aeromonas TaxID=257493 RepID=UPI003F78B9F3